MGLDKGHKLKDVTRNRRVEIRLTDDEFETLEECSKELDTTRTEVLTIGLNLVNEMLHETK